MDDEIRRQGLTKMPKPPVDDIAISAATQAKWVLLASLLFPALAAVFYVLSIYAIDQEFWQAWMFAALAIFPTPGLIALLLYLWYFVQNRKLRALTGGEYYVHWRIPENQWRQYCDQLHRTNRRAAAIVCLCFAAVGLVFAGLAYGDGNIFFGSAIVHFLALILLAAAIGYIIGLFCQWLGHMTEQLMRTHTPQVVIGPAGLYITGQFWPTKTVGQRLISVHVSGDEPSTLHFVYAISSKHGVQRKVLQIPFPADAQADAQMVAKLLGVNVL